METARITYSQESPDVFVPGVRLSHPTFMEPIYVVASGIRWPGKCSLTALYRSQID